MKTIKTTKGFIGAFNRRFNRSTKDPYNKGKVWEEAGQPVTGENNYCNGLEIYDYYSLDYSNREGGTLKVVSEWATARGWYHEARDGATIVFYLD